MQLAIELPEEIAQQLAQHWDNLPRRILEAIALEAYRSNTLTTAQVQALLQLPSRWAVEDFLQQHHALIDYTTDDLEADVATLEACLPE
ncbi:UPF0175 family protein [Spirulina major]|uniref:UPF0175 family protein n=1 Tax=Spirulina major TaxID=270636 RepID=UPI000932B558|nr:UPF0175 family protein [Spirulina major]